MMSEHFIKKKVCVLGLGYIGLPTSALIASAGHQVVGVDVNVSIVEDLRNGKLHINEPGLSEIVKKVVGEELLRVQTLPEKADVYIICVPTPFYWKNQNPIPNLEYVKNAVKAIAPCVVAGNIVILESTSPVGTTEEIRKILENEGVDTSKISIAYCPERVLPGYILSELINNDRIVGGLTIEAANNVEIFYKSIGLVGTVNKTDARTAEMVKLVENSFRDVNIAFANELSIICNNNDIDCEQVITLANKHPRVHVLNPSSGVGGHCIAVDPWFLVSLDRRNSKIIKKAREVNLNKTEWVYKQIEAEADKMFKKVGRPAKIAVLGLTYKPNVDDVRESPSLHIAAKLISKGYKVYPVDPKLKKIDGITLYNLDESIDESDIVVILVRHDEFSNLKVENKICMVYC
jgi:UDP-N-acetyl-D-mannosaminuronic acid dehydrogenase